MAKLPSDTLRSPSSTTARSTARAERRFLLRDAILAGLLAFLLPAAAATVVYLGAAQGQIAQASSQLQAQAEYLVSLIDAGTHATLAGDDEKNSPVYKKLMEPLQRARELAPAWGRLFTGRLDDGRISVLLETKSSRQAAPLTPAADETGNLLAALAKTEARADRPAIFPDNSAGQGHGGFLSVIVPMGNPQGGKQDFLYLETTRQPLEDDLSLARDARDICLIAAAFLGLATGLIVFVWRHRTFLRHVRAVDKALESEELFRSTYEKSSVGMYLAGTNGRILRTNRAFCRFIDYSESELLKLPPSAYTREAAPDPSSAGPAAPGQMERCYRRRDGRLVWGLVSTALVRDVGDDVSHYLIQVVDITERKILADIQQQSEERLGLAADVGRVGIWDCDMKTGAVVWNGVMHDIHQTDAETFAPTFAIQQGFILEEDRESFIAVFNQCRRDGRPFAREYRIVSQLGTVRHVKTRARFLRDEAGKPVRAVGTAIDISVEKAEAAELIRTREAALAADKAKSEFLAMMSHEIRTPLNGVLGFTSMLKTTSLDPVQAGYIETMESSGERLLALVNDILDLSKIEAREIHLELTTFAIRPFLREIHAQLYAQASEKNLQYDLVIAETVPDAIHTDRQRLGQILTNLLGNAVKFTASGRVVLHLASTPGDENLAWHFAVQDTGCGIPPESMPNLFQAFYQVDSSNTRRHGGTGLGLAVSRRFAKLINATFSVQSELGQGSQFTLELLAPAGTAPPAPSAPLVLSGTDQEKIAARLRGRIILVVEDNPVNRKLCGLQLKRLGCVVEYAETGTEALEKVRQARCEAVLMDVQLPDLDGCDATRQIRREEFDGRHLPIIALTANAMPEDRSRCLAAGMDDFLSKPLKFETLVATLVRWI